MQKADTGFCDLGQAMSCSEIRGTYIPTAKNGMVQDLYANFGFEQIGPGEEPAEGETAWRYDLDAKGSVENRHIEITHLGEDVENDGAQAA